MNGDERYEAWRRQRAEAPVPDGFADRVMERVMGREDRRPARIVPVLLMTTAGAAALVRVAAVLALLLME